MQDQHYFIRNTLLLINWYMTTKTPVGALDVFMEPGRREMLWDRRHREFIRTTTTNEAI